MKQKLTLYWDNNEEVRVFRVRSYSNVVEYARKNSVTSCLTQIILGLCFVLFHTHAVAGYFISRGLLEGRDWMGVTNKLNEKWIPTLWTSWHFWPAANVLNFALVPLQFRALYWSVLSFFWQGYLTQTNEQQET